MIEFNKKIPQEIIDLTNEYISDHKKDMIFCCEKLIERLTFKKNKTPSPEETEFIEKEIKVFSSLKDQIFMAGALKQEDIERLFVALQFVKGRYEQEVEHFSNHILSLQARGFQ